MPRTMSLLSISATMLAFCLWAGGAQAQAPRTWVSGVGDDANPCSRTAPCKTFAGAISKTACGGEIDALDPGGFGAVTITKPITIDGGGGQVASVLASGTNGINVNFSQAPACAGAVILRNLRINGAPGSGLIGINFVGSVAVAVHVENCDIFGFDGNPGDGILVNTSSTNASLFVNNTFLQNNVNGVVIAPSGGNIRSILQNVRADGNSGFGFDVAPTNGAGAGTVITDSSAVAGGTGLGVTGGKVFLGNDVIIRNGTGVSVGGTGQVETYGTNMIDGNTPGGDIVGSFTSITQR